MLSPLLLATLVASSQFGMEVYLMEQLVPKVSFKLLWNLNAKCLAKFGF
jgi:hypothetical protein